MQSLRGFQAQVVNVFQERGDYDQYLLAVPADPELAGLAKEILQVLATAGRAEEFGVLRTGLVSIDMSRVAARPAEVVAGMVEYNRQPFLASGFELVLGWARLVV